MEKLDTSGTGELVASISHDHKIKFWNIAFLEVRTQNVVFSIKPQWYKRHFCKTGTDVFALQQKFFPQSFCHFSMFFPLQLQSHSIHLFLNLYLGPVHGSFSPDSAEMPLMLHAHRAGVPKLLPLT